MLGLGRWRQKDYEFKPKLDYIARFCLKSKKGWAYSSVIEHLHSMLKARVQTPGQKKNRVTGEYCFSSSQVHQNAAG